jgi:23S rRNA (uracil-5-)-methyltransferase RumA
MCGRFGVCGGCCYLDIPYEEELKRKQEEARALLAPFVDENNFHAIIPAPKRGAYRNKMEYAFGDEGRDGRLALGIRNKRSMYEVSAPDECELVDADFKLIASCVINFFRNTGERFYHRRRHTGTLRHLVIRRGEFTGELLINLVTTSALAAPLDELVKLILSLPLDGNVAGILHTVNDGVADTVKDENVRVLFGVDFFFEKINGLTFKVTAFSFFQTNSAGAEKLYDVVRGYAGGGQTVLDLYCGTGTIAQLLASGFTKVTGVELNEAAVVAARENARLNNINNASFFAGDVLHFIDTLKAGAPDMVVVDPPRDGLHPKALEKLSGLDNIVYVSCKPASLARDLQALSASGFIVEDAVCVDMFPRTAHVETVVKLKKRGRLR